MPCRTIEIIEYISSAILYAEFIISAIAIILVVYITTIIFDSRKDNDKSKPAPREHYY